MLHILAFSYTVKMMQMDSLEDLQVYPTWFAFKGEFHLLQMIPRYTQLDFFKEETNQPTQKGFTRKFFGRKKSGRDFFKCS